MTQPPLSPQDRLTSRSSHVLDHGSCGQGNDGPMGQPCLDKAVPEQVCGAARKSQSAPHVHVLVCIRANESASIAPRAAPQVDRSFTNVQCPYHRHGRGGLQSPLQPTKRPHIISSGLQQRCFCPNKGMGHTFAAVWWRMAAFFFCAMFLVTIVLATPA